MAAELIGDLERIYQRKKAANKELKQLVAETGTTLMDLHGIGPSGAARLLVEVADITRFPNRAHFASWNGTAPIDASSGDQVRHRLSRAGNRQINRVLHIMATVQLRNPTQGRAYYDRRKADGKTSMEAMRCVKRRLSDIVFRRMLDDAITHMVTGPGGQRGTTTDSSATGSHPSAGTSDKPLPGPATLQATPATTAGQGPFIAAFPTPCHSADSQPKSSSVCLTAARTGSPSTGGNATLLTQRGAMSGKSFWVSSRPATLMDLVEMCSQPMDIQMVGVARTFDENGGWVAVGWGCSQMCNRDGPRRWGCGDTGGPFGSRQCAAGERACTV